MNKEFLEDIDDIANPLDLLEEIVVTNNWSYERVADDELRADVRGAWCVYHLSFIWRDDLQALHFLCSFDTVFGASHHPQLYELLASINQKMMLGHFDFIHDASNPGFRHTLLLRGMRFVTHEIFEDLIDIAMTECERFYPAFQMIQWGNQNVQQALTDSIYETVGEA